MSTRIIKEAPFREPIHVTHWEYPVKLTGPIPHIQRAGIELSEVTHSAMRYRADPNGQALLLLRIERSVRDQFWHYASRRGLACQYAVEYTELFSHPFRFTDMTAFEPPVWPDQQDPSRKLVFSKNPPRWYVGVDTLDFRLFELLTTAYHVPAISYATGTAPLTYFRWPFNLYPLRMLVMRHGIQCRHASGLPYEQAITKESANTSQASGS